MLLGSAKGMYIYEYIYIYVYIYIYISKLFLSTLKQKLKIL